MLKADVISGTSFRRPRRQKGKRKYRRAQQVRVLGGRVILIHVHIGHEDAFSTASLFGLDVWGVGSAL
jgi:hypothetical protein